MKNNVTMPLGSIAVVDKVEKDLGLISAIFGKSGGRSKNFIGATKLLLCNRIEDTVSVRQIIPTSSEEKFELLGIKGGMSERSLYRTVERIGKTFPVLLDRYQQKLKEHNLIDPDQIADFSSSYFEGKDAGVAEYGYSRDKRPDRKQMMW